MGARNQSNLFHGHSIKVTFFKITLRCSLLIQFIIIGKLLWNNIQADFEKKNNFHF